jgi:hypothetical protein
MIGRHSSTPRRGDLFMPPSMPVSHTGNKDAVYPSLTVLLRC